MQSVTGSQCIHVLTSRVQVISVYHQHAWEWFMHAIKINTSTGKWLEIVRWSWIKICASPHLTKVGVNHFCVHVYSINMYIHRIFYINCHQDPPFFLSGLWMSVCYSGTHTCQCVKFCGVCMMSVCNCIVCMMSVCNCRVCMVSVCKVL